MRTTAVRDGDDWVLNGTKNFITNATHAGIAVVLAVTDANDRKHGVTAFAIEMDRKGIRPGKKENKLGMRISRHGANWCWRIAASRGDNVLGEVGHGFIDAMKVLDGGRISIGALALGIARGAYDAARDYSKERTAFGQPICGIPGDPVHAGRHGDGDRGRATALLSRGGVEGCRRDGHASGRRWRSSTRREVAVRATEKGVQIFGGYGFIKEYPAEKYYRDVKLCTIGEGTSEIQRTIISRGVLAG